MQISTLVLTFPATVVHTLVENKEAPGLLGLAPVYSVISSGLRRGEDGCYVVSGKKFGEVVYL